MYDVFFCILEGCTGTSLQTNKKTGELTESCSIDEVCLHRGICSRKLVCLLPLDFSDFSDCFP